MSHNEEHRDLNRYLVLLLFVAW